MTMKDDVGASGKRSVVVVILGTQWGDEGKGKIVDLLCQGADVVCRCQVCNVSQNRSLWLLCLQLAGTLQQPVVLLATTINRYLGVSSLCQFVPRHFAFRRRCFAPGSCSTGTVRHQYYLPHNGQYFYYNTHC